MCNVTLLKCFPACVSLVSVAKGTFRSVCVFLGKAVCGTSRELLENYEETSRLRLCLPVSKLSEANKTPQQGVVIEEHGNDTVLTVDVLCSFDKQGIKEILTMNQL